MRSIPIVSELEGALASKGNHYYIGANAEPDTDDEIPFYGKRHAAMPMH